MNILFLHSIVIAPDKGGIERVTQTLTDEFVANGNTVFFIAAKPTWKEFADKTRQFFLPNETQFDCSENAEFFEKFLREHGINVVIFQWADGKRFPFGEICRKLGVPVISAIHTDPCFYEQRLRGSGLLKSVKRRLRFRRQAKIYRANAACSTTTVLLSERFIPGFLKHFPKKEKPDVCAIPNPSTYENQSPDLPAKKKELLFVGRMEMAVKQPQLLLQAWVKIQDRVPDWTLRMVGGGFDFEAVKALSVDLGVKRVVFEGFQQPAEFYRRASVFCMTSAYEGFPMVLVEAMSFGCVPVAFDSFESLHDIVSDGENGFVVPAFDVEKYADALMKLMSDDALRERLALAAHNRSALFSKTQIVKNWSSLL